MGGDFLNLLQYYMGVGGDGVFPIYYNITIGGERTPNLYYVINGRPLTGKTWKLKTQSTHIIFGLGVLSHLFRRHSEGSF